MKFFRLGKGKSCSGNVFQYKADLAQYFPVLAAHDQQLESAAQAVAITHRGSHLQDVRRERDGKLQGNNFAGLQLTAEGRPEAVLAEFTGSAPICGRPAFAKYRDLNAHVKTMTGETPQRLMSFGGRVRVIAQSCFSISN